MSSERLHSVARENLAFLWKYVRGLGVDDAEADDIVQEALLVLTRKLDIVQAGKERSFLIGCAADCQIESGWNCSYERTQSVCRSVQLEGRMRQWRD